MQLNVQEASASPRAARRPASVVVLASDPSLSERVQDMLRGSADLEFRADALSSVEAASLLDRLSPDVVVADAGLLGGALQRLNQRWSNTSSVILICQSPEKAALLRARRIPALCPPWTEKDLLDLLRQAAQAPDQPRIKELRWIFRGEYGMKLFLKCADRVRIYELSEIHSITAQDAHSCIVHRAFSSDTVPKSFRSVVERIQEPEFIRVGRQALVNLQQVTSIEPLPGNNVRISLANGQQLVVPPSFATRVYRAFQKITNPRRKRM